MYNKLNPSNRDKHLYDPEFEPPKKKLVSDCDTLIKQLSEKQRNTKVNLDEQLSAKTQFYKSTEMLSVTSYTSGSVSLNEFNSVLGHMNAVEKLKSCGVSKEDIELFYDHKSGKGDKHKNLNGSVRAQRLKDIYHKIQHFNCDESRESPKAMGLKHETTLALKPSSMETKLLKFAEENGHTSKHKLPGPMDEIKNVEKKLIEDLTPVNLKKIKRKARALGRQIESLSNPTIDKSSVFNEHKLSLVEKSNWDVINKPQCQTNKIEKVFTCKQQNFYTIKNGEIVKLKSEQQSERSVQVQNRLTIDEIKKLPKFHNYEEGTPSKVLYLKNLANGVQQEDLEGILGEFSKSIVSVNILKGRMHGQAFLEFGDELVAQKVLEKCNGSFLKNKPLIIQFGKQKKS